MTVDGRVSGYCSNSVCGSDVVEKVRVRDMSLRCVEVSSSAYDM